MKKAITINNTRGSAIHTMTEKEIDNKTFTGLDLSFARFFAIDLSTYKFIDCNLDGAEFVDSKFDNAQFSNCSMPRLHIGDSYAKRCTFTKCNFEVSTFRKVLLSNSRFIECGILQSFLEYVDLTESTFTKCKIDMCILDECTMESADMLTSQMSQMNRLIKTDLSKAKLDNKCVADKELNMKIYKQIADIVLPTAEAVLKKNYYSKTLPECLLDMDRWHSECGTKHCLAGWYVKLHPRGEEIEKLADSTPFAAHVLSQDKDFYRLFYSSTEKALEWLQEISEM